MSADLLIAQSGSLSELLCNICDTYGTLVAFHEKKQGFYQHVSFGRFGEELEALGTVLSRLLAPHSRVLIVGKIGYAVTLATLAVASGVGLAVPLSADRKGEALIKLAQKSGATAVLYTQEAEAAVAALDLPCKLSLACLSEYIGQGRALLASGDTTYRTQARAADEAVMLSYTASGKGVLLSHKSLLRALYAFVKTNTFDTRDIVFSHLSPARADAWLCGILLPLCVGASVAFAEDGRHMMQNMREIHPTAMVTVPVVAAQLADKFYQTAVKADCEAAVYRAIKLTDAVRPYAARLAAKRRLLMGMRAIFGGALRTLLVLGERQNGATHRALTQIGISTVFCYVPRVLGMPVTAGGALSGVTVMLDENDGIFLRGEGLFLGYDNETPYDPQKPLATGDVGCFDARGGCLVRGRVAERIVRADGTVICPEELEALIEGSALVKQAVVVGVPCGNGDIEPAAMIVPADGVKNEEDKQVHERAVGEWLTFVNGKLPTQIKITAFAIATTALPCDVSGHVQRQAVAEQLLAAAVREHQDKDKGEQA